MIKLIEDNRLPSVSFTDGFSVTKIRANFLAYGCGYDFLRVWYQQNENGLITALVEKLEDALFIVAEESADLEELREFIEVIGYSSVQGTPELLYSLGLEFKAYDLLTLTREGDGELPPYPDINLVYSLLFGEENSSIKKIDYEGFYTDLSHKIRRGLAAATVFNEAVCVASHITDQAAVISGVAVKSSLRKKGLGSKALVCMTKALSGRKIFVAAEKEVSPFYIKNGFKKHSQTAIYLAKEI